jgi:hypothetical protein
VSERLIGPRARQQQKGAVMRALARISAALAGIVMTVGTPSLASAQSNVTVRTYSSDDTLLRIGRYAFAGGKTLDLSVGIGSAAFHHPKDPPNVLWTLGDRGPNIACSEMKETAGVELNCREIKNSRVYPTPSYAPSIYRVMLLDDGTFQVTDVIKLKDRDGHPLNVMAAEITPVKKTIRFDTADHGVIVGKTEGMTLLGDGALVLINDDDFGINGARTQIVVVRGTAIKRH